MKVAYLVLVLSLGFSVSSYGQEICEMQTNSGKIFGVGPTRDIATMRAAEKCQDQLQAKLGHDEDTALTIIDICANAACKFN